MAITAIANIEVIRAIMKAGNGGFVLFSDKVCVLVGSAEGDTVPVLVSAIVGVVAL